MLRNQFNIPFFLGGTALLIVVGVALDTMGQLEAQLIMRHYEGFLKKGRIGGGSRWFALDTMRQIDSQLMMRNYEGFLK